LTAIRSLTKVRGMDKTRIPQVRSFNRVVAERFSTLHDRASGRCRGGEGLLGGTTSPIA
jgi:hypothetical protein